MAANVKKVILPLSGTQEDSASGNSNSSGRKIPRLPTIDTSVVSELHK